MAEYAPQIIHKSHRCNERVSGFVDRSSVAQQCRHRTAAFTKSALVQRAELRRRAHRVGLPVDWTDRLASRFASTVFSLRTTPSESSRTSTGTNKAAGGRPRSRERHRQGVDNVGDGFTSLEALEDQRRDLIEFHGAILSADVRMIHVGLRNRIHSGREIGTTPLHTIFGPSQKRPSELIT
jgi:hypothetical protein